MVGVVFGESGGTETLDGVANWQEERHHYSRIDLGMPLCRRGRDGSRGIACRPGGVLLKARGWQFVLSRLPPSLLRIAPLLYFGHRARHTGRTTQGVACTTGQWVHHG